MRHILRILGDRIYKQKIIVKKHKIVHMNMTLEELIKNKKYISNFHGIQNTNIIIIK